MKKILEKIRVWFKNKKPQIEQLKIWFNQVDKLKHLVAGALIFMVVYTLAQVLFFNVTQFILMFLAAIIDIIIIYAKEYIWDSYLKRGTKESGDIVMGVIGLVITFIYTLIIK